VDAGKRELEFLGTLGRGGFGTVYLANLHGRDRFVRRVAVKVLRQSVEDPELVARQRDEARLLGLLTHQAIVQVVDLTEVQGRPAVVMEYVEGIDLAAVIRSHRANGTSVPVRAALEVIAIAASGLDAAWNTAAPGSDRPLRAIHRDVKPANILLTAHGGVKLLDFGIARADVEREGVTGSAFYGTVGYMGPEFWLQEPIGPAYDVYALGVTLLETVSPHEPTRPPLEPTRFAEWQEGRVGLAPPELRPLLTAMLALRPEERPSAARVQEQVEALADHASDEPLSRFARRVVPPLVQARQAAMDAEALPTRTVAGVLEAGQTPPSAVVTPAATPTPPKPAPLWFRWRLALVALLLAAVAGAAAWPRIDRAPDTTAEAPEAPSSSEAAPPAPPVEPAPATASAVLAAVEPVPAPVAPTLSVAAEPPPARAPVGRPAPDMPPTRAAQPAPEPAPAPATPTLAAPAEPAPAAPEPAAARPTWRIAIASVPPGASVTIDGVARGTTALEGVDLGAGRHQLVLSLDGIDAARALDAGPELPTRLTYNFSTGRWRSEYR